MLYDVDFINNILTSKSNAMVKLAARQGVLNLDSGVTLCKCPFHKSDFEELFIDTENNTWACPVCGKYGNAISFIMLLKDYSFDNAVKYLAKRAHIEVPEITETENYNDSPNDVFYKVNAAAAGYFYESLLSGKSLEAQKYFRKRKLTLDSIVKFRLGCAPGFGQNLYNYLKEKGFKDDVLIMSGLIGISADGKPYDKFRNRVMFPIADKDNRIIGFGGRVLDDSKPKYLNSPATPVFDKKQNLYGFNLAKKTKEDFFIFCEGYMDVIAMHQAGFDNAVASLGTALTAEQVRLISEYTDKVVLAYDSDGPGINAAIRALDLFKAESIDCKVINMKDCKDPDEFIKKHGKKAFRDCILNAESGQHYKFRQLKKIKDSMEFYDLAVNALIEEDDNIG